MPSKINNPYPDESPVLVWYPLPRDDDQNRDSWSWLPGTVLCRGGINEWCVVVEAPPLRDEDETFPMCFRDASEIQRVSEERWDCLYEALEVVRD